MLQRRKKSKIYRTILYIFFSSFLFLITLNILFPSFSWFRKRLIINPVINNPQIDTLKIESILSGVGISFSSIELAKDYYNIKLKDGGQVYLSFKKDFNIQISSLTSILKQLTINGKRFNFIDFRFEKPLVSF